MRPLQRASALGAVIAFATVALGAQPALAGCTVDVTYKNTFSEDITTNPYWSRVKIKGGWYKKLKNSNVFITIPAGGQKTRSYTLDFGCNKDRRYKFHMVWAGYVYYKYKPSETGWTQSTDITVTFDWPFP